MNIAGIYWFLSKDKSDYYIGSSINMKIRYNRHMFNLKHSDIRYSQANPKFYNYIRKYGLENLDFSCSFVRRTPQRIGVLTSYKKLSYDV